MATIESKLGELQIHYALLTEIETHPENANVGDILAIKESIRHNGFYAPLVVQSKTGYIIAGNHRYMAAMEMGMEQVPVVYLDVDDEAARRMMLADNRITRLGQDDSDQLAALLETLADSDIGLVGTGFTHDDLNDLQDKLSKNDLDFIPEPDIEKPPAKESDYVVEPIPGAGGVCSGVMVTRSDREPITMDDFNAIRIALGLGRARRGALATAGIEDWA